MIYCKEALNKRWLLSVALLAAVVTFIVYIPALSNQFVDYDDLGYIPVATSHAKLNLHTLVWAFSSFNEANWHPLTMLSLVLDASIWGDNPFGFHLTNIVLHAAAVFLSCYLFSNLLSVAQRSAAVSNTLHNDTVTSQQNICSSLLGALFFGVHPLRVESVVWASERKDVLCMFWIISALLLYIHHVRLLKAGSRFWRMPSYWLVALTTCLALLSKPLATSLPLIFLIVDWYPFARIRTLRGFWAAALEKVPLFIMSAGCIIMTMCAQQVALSRAAQADPVSRLLIAVKALLFYVFKTVWPMGLSALYPHPGSVSQYALVEYAVYAVIVVLISLTAIVAIKRSRMWLALWMFYVVTLTPMLGIVQVGAQWTADRYSYFPALGLSLLWGWGVVRLVSLMLSDGSHRWAVLVVCAALIQIVLLLTLTGRQIPVWRTTEALASRIISQIPLHPEAPYYTRAKYRNENGAYLAALQDIDMSLRSAQRYGQIKKYPELYIAKAHILSNLGRIQEALVHANLALETSLSKPPAVYVSFRNKLALQVAAGVAGP